MKTKLLLTTFRDSVRSDLRLVIVRLFLILALSPVPSALSQIPHGFNYQAIARDGSGNPITNATINVKLSILTDTSGFYQNGTGQYVWEEEQTGIKTNAFGLFAVVFGNPGATKIQGSAASFSAINWSAPTLYIGTKIANPSDYKNLGAAKLWSVPYAMVSDSTKALLKGSKLSVVSSNDGTTDALFEVKRKDGQTVFAVYPEAVNIYLPRATSKGTKGGFAIGGFDGSKTTPQDYFRVTRDSVRIYIDQTPKTVKGATKGGFAIGGFDESKSAIAVQDLLTVSNDSIRMYINRKPAIKGATKGGFAIGGFDPGSKGVTQDLLTVSNDSIRMYIDRNPASGKGATKGGFAIGGFGTEKTDQSFYMNMTPKNYFIGDKSGILTTGLYNSYFGYESGIVASTGEKNVFIGYHSGMNNSNASFNVFLGNETGLINQGNYNTFLGYHAGYSNTSGTTDAFIGYNAGQSNNTGTSNVFIGNLSGYTNTRGGSNLAIGDRAGFANDTGSFNVMLGFKAGYNSNTSYNTFLGYQAGAANISGKYNAFMGYNAGLSNLTGTGNVFIGNESGELNQAGDDNVFLGFNAGQNNRASNNVFLGFQCGSNNYDGYDNVFIGHASGMSNSSGHNNCFMGYGSGNVNEIGINNVFLGNQAGANNISGSSNTFLGNQSGFKSSGMENTIVGHKADMNLETGDNNTVVGQSALNNQRHGSNNTAIGATSTVLSANDTYDNSTAIGYGVQINASNQVIIGNSDITTFFCKGIAYATTSLTGNVYVDPSTGQVLRSTSSRRYKTDIADMDINTRMIYKLRPVSFNSIQDGNRYFGLIAEEVAENLPELVEWARAKDVIKGSSSEELIPESVKYPVLSVLLLKEVQKHQAVIDDQKIAIETQTQIIAAQNEKMKSMEMQLNNLMEQIVEIRAGMQK